MIVSGFSSAEQPDVVRAIGLELADERVEGDWAAALLRG